MLTFLMLLLRWHFLRCLNSSIVYVLFFFFKFCIENERNTLSIPYVGLLAGSVVEGAYWLWSQKLHFIERWEQKERRTNICTARTPLSSRTFPESNRMVFTRTCSNSVLVVLAYGAIRAGWSALWLGAGIGC